jgi:hypothetical protein
MVMTDIMDTLRQAARVLHRSARAGDEAALARLRQDPELRRLEPAERAAACQRRHALAALARELGFRSWGDLAALMRGARPTDFGTLLHEPRMTAHWNVWCADEDEARRIRGETDGFLLAYRHQYLVVDRHYLTTLGLDPDAPEWAAIGRDWVRPGDPSARRRLAAQRLSERWAELGSPTRAPSAGPPTSRAPRWTVEP